MAAMRPARPLALAALLLASSASAHLTAVNMDVAVQGDAIVVMAGTPDGYPVNGAKVEYLMVAPDGTTFRSGLSERADGEYAAPKPQAPAGPYTLYVRDTTFPREALEVKADVKWPLAAPLRLTLPPSTAGPSTGLLFALLAVPVLVAVAVLAWALLRRGPPAEADPA